MTLPVSKYEELLETVRNLKQQTIRVRELASPLLDTIISANITGESSTTSFNNHYICNSSTYLPIQDENKDLLNLSILEKTNFYYQHRSISVMDTLLMERQPFDGEDASGIEDVSSHISSIKSEPRDKYHNFGSNVHDNMWHSEPSPLNLIKRNRNENQLSPHESVSPTDMTSVMSFASSSGAAVPFELCLNNSELTMSNECEEARQRQQQLDVKVEMVYSLLAVLGTSECPDMGETLLALSSSPDSSRAMRQAGCLSILVQLVHAKDDENGKTREKAAQALKNLVQGQADEKQKKKELKILKLLEDIRMHCNRLPGERRIKKEVGGDDDDDDNDDAAAAKKELDQDHPTQATENIIKLSFDEGYRHTICELGGIFTLARLIEMEHSRHGSLATSDKCITLRRYAGMALTNLTFGHGHNKSLLCSFNVFIQCLVAQLGSTTDELRQVTASVLRNLSWRADSPSRSALRDAGAVTALMQAAMKSHREATLKSVLSALWNLSAHCSTNKADICAVPGALAFLVDMLGYRPPSRTLTIIENAGGILRNVSSHIAIRDDYRAILRDKGCLPLLLQQLKSASLTVVSNACGTLWNLSAKCEEDQRTLWDMGAAPMLRSLNHSKHVMIATGSRAALKNLLSSRPAHQLFNHMDSTARDMGLPTLPTLGARKQRALAKDLDQNLSETCDNIEPTSPPQLLSPISCELSVVVNTNNTKQKISTIADTQLVESFASLTLNKIQDNIPILNKLSNYTFEYDQDNNTEEPVDYSQKYTEKKSRNSTEIKNVKTIKNATATSAPTYSDYAETDLDQPTNYSLRYAENDSDSDINIIQDEEQLDTVKTYCTEGTPLNFSTATSMSDLRQIDAVVAEDKEKKKTNTKYKKEIIKKVSDCPSGLLTPEKPIKYCEEGTPRSFSRHSSFSSLNIDDSVQNNSKQMVPNEKDHQEQEKITTHDDKIDENNSKIKVKFENVITNNNIQGAEETPLMFSRCSSLCSLSSVEQHSIHDDRSSIISDFSRLTSGIVSPSELPDSPTQTVPPSPRQRRAPVPIDFLSQSQSKPQTQQPQINQQPKSIFEDNIIKFKQANTPIEFSTNTSLSSLTIDDEPSATVDFSLLAASVLNSGAIEMNTKTLAANSSQESENVATLVVNNKDADEQAEDDMLAACINIGIQNNRHREKKQQKQPMMNSKFTRPHRNSPHRTSIPIIKSSVSKTNDSKLTSPLSHQNQSHVSEVTDTTRVYCTEDTPAMLSYAGSQSDLSLLSLESATVNRNRKSVDDKHNNILDLSDDSSNLSGDNESNILAECIQSGMPKAKGQSHSHSNQPELGEKRNIRYNNGAACDEIETYAVEDSPCQFSLRSSLSDLTIDGVKITSKLPVKKANVIPDDEVILSRAESLSSLSVESFGSTENADQVLLEQCISSGMPTKNNKTLSSSKNVQTTSVALGLDWTKQNIRVTDETIIKKESVNIEKTETKTIIENFTSWPQNEEHNLLNTEMIIKNNHDDINKCSDLLDGSIEDNCYNVNHNKSTAAENRMLDPDAMIESLDRFTAELVSQSSHLQHSESKFKMIDSNNMQQSCGNGNDTWNEDTSPNDVSFPSISVSAPLVASFASACESIDSNSNKHVVPQEEQHQQSLFSFDTTSSTTMTDSTLIAIEAANVVNNVRNEQMEMEMQQSITSLSVDLENMKAPSVMDSLISLTSSVSISDSPRHSPLTTRKRSLPIANLMRLRALTNTNKNSYENLSQIQDGPTSISSCSNLDYMKPPSIMGDFLDLVDMENSMISVASITSEATDFISAAADLCDSTADIITDNIFEDCLTHTIPVHLDDTTITEYSDANSITPVQSDFASSSTESTPKKERSISTRMTPKQRRQYAKDRYKTYTVAAEMVIRQVSDVTSTGTVNSSNTNTIPNKLTPKEKRQLDRDRFQTRVLDANILQQQINNIDDKEVQVKSNNRVTIKQRRLEDKERFRTQTLNNIDSEQDDEDLHLVLAQQANIVLNTLHADELLDCETLSLVSNDDESELNSVSSVNYRTYHKSWGFSKNLPVVQTTSRQDQQLISDCTSSNTSNNDQLIVENEKIPKPKINKPNGIIAVQNHEQEKTIRGKRKPLYPSSPGRKPSSTPVKNMKPKPLRTMTSNLVKNVTTAIKTNKNIVSSNATVINKPPLATKKLNVIRSNTTPFNSHSNIVKNTTIKLNSSLENKHELLKNRSSSNGSIPLNSKPLERQGTFTKDNNKKIQSSKIPESKIPTNKFRSSVQNRTISSTTMIPTKMTSRSPSADRDFGFKNRRSSNTTIHQSNSTQSLQSNDCHQHSTTKRSSNPDIGTQRSKSNISITATRTTPDSGASAAINKRKPVASRISSLWKKNNIVTTDVAAANTTSLNSHSSNYNTKMRKKNNAQTDLDETKRLSRLGSFVKVDEISVT